MENDIFLLKINDEEHTDIYPDIVSAEVEEDEYLAGVFNIRLAIRLQKDGAWTWIDDERLSTWNKVSISVGIAENVCDVFTGYITRVKPYFGAEQHMCYLDVKGMDGSVLMNREEKLKAWAGKKDSDIATQIFSDYDLTPVVTDTKICHKEAISTIIQRGTDIQFLKRLARRNGFECFVRNNTGYFRPPQLSGEPQKELAVQFCTESNLSYFRAEIDVLQPTNVEMHQLGLFTGKNLDAAVEAAQQKQLGKTPAQELAPMDIDPATVVVKHTKANSQPAMQALCRGLYDEAEWILQGEGEVVGKFYNDVLRARELVTIKGVGKTYSGVYYVTRVKHVFADNSYVQEFKVKRNALNPEGTEDFSSGGSLLSSGLG